MERCRRQDRTRKPWFDDIQFDLRKFVVDWKEKARNREDAKVHYRGLQSRKDYYYCDFVSFPR